MAKFKGPYGEFDTDDVYRLAQLGRGEAWQEGDRGLAAVMQVAANRMKDSRYPNKLADVALQPKQFSAFQIPKLRRDMDSFHNSDPKGFERAVTTAFDVLSGAKRDDQIGDSTHYYSPAGMEAYRRQGMQSHVIPPWLAGEAKASGGVTRLGNHVFAGSVRGGGSPPRAAAQSEGEPASPSAPARGQFAATARPASAPPTNIKTDVDIDREFGDRPEVAAEMKRQAAIVRGEQGAPAASAPKQSSAAPMAFAAQPKREPAVAALDRVREPPAPVVEEEAPRSPLQKLAALFGGGASAPSEPADPVGLLDRLMRSEAPGGVF